MKNLFTILLAFLITSFAVQGLYAGKGNSDDQGANFGALYYDGETVGTVATPTSMPGKGIDTIYVISNGAEGQLGITSVAPGDKNYHGGRWAVHVATWTMGPIAPMVFTSAEEVEAAYEMGYLDVTRMPDADFVCPIQKNK